MDQQQCLVHLSAAEPPVDDADHGEAPHTESPPQASAQGSDVLQIIAEADAQLERIRAARNVQDEQIDLLASRFKTLEQTEKQVQESRAQLEQTQADLQEQQQQLHEAQAALDDQQQVLAAREADIEHRETHDAQVRNELESLRADLETEREALYTLHKSLVQQQEAIDEQRDELQQSNAASEHVAQALQQDVDALTSQQQGLTEKLESTTREADSLRQSLEQRDATIAQQKEQLDLASSKLVEFSRVVDEQSARLEQASTADALIDKQKQQIDSLTAQLEQQSSDEQALHERDQRIATLEQQLRQAQEQATQATQDDQQRRDALDQQTARIRRVASHLQRRHKRLQRVRTLLRETERKKPARCEDDPAMRAAAMESLQKKQQTLAERQDALAAAEQTMHRRWARPRAVATAGWVLILVSLNAAVAWVAAGALFPTPQAASAMVSPEQQPGEKADAEQLERWQDWHAAMLEDETFLNTVADRCAERRLGEVDAILASAAASPDVDGSLVLSVEASDDAQRVGAVLDVLVSTLVTQSSRSAELRSGQLAATAESARGSEHRYATLHPVQIDQRQLTASVSFLAVGLAVTASLIAGVYLRLVRAKRVFDEGEIWA